MTQSAVPQPTDPPAPTAARPLVLLVDDEEAIRDLGRVVLEAAGFEVVTATDGVEAVAAYEARRPGVGLVVMDLTMPRMSGQDACRAILRLDPAARVLFSSGYAADGWSDAGGLGMLPKPYRSADLVRAVRSALAAAG